MSQDSLRISPQRIRDENGRPETHETGSILTLNSSLKHDRGEDTVKKTSMSCESLYTKVRLSRGSSECQPNSKEAEQTSSGNGDIETGSRSIPLEIALDPTLVTWTHQHDPENPKNFKNLTKLFVGLVAGLMSFVVSLAISIFPKYLSWQAMSLSTTVTSYNSECPFSSWESVSVSRGGLSSMAHLIVHDRTFILWASIGIFWSEKAACMRLVRICWLHDVRTNAPHEQALGEVLIGQGMYMVWVSATLYVQDLYVGHVNSALAACAFVRYAVGSVFPMCADPLYHKLGIQWAIALLGLSCAILVPFHVFFYLKGERIRQWSKFTVHQRIDAAQNGR